MFTNYESADTNQLLRRASAGDQDALGQLLQRDRERLRRAVALRLDRRLAGRVDPSDVLQEAQLEASRRLAEYVQNPTMPFFLWLRLITLQRILTFHRRHLGAQARTVEREVQLGRGIPAVHPSNSTRWGSTGICRISCSAPFANSARVPIPADCTWWTGIFWDSNRFLNIDAATGRQL